MPPAFQPPIGAHGPASPPTEHAGLQAAAVSKVREAIKLIELALPGLAKGSEEHKSVIDALSKLAKAFPASEEVPGIQATQLRGLAQQAQSSGMMQSLMRAAQQQGGGQGGPPQGQPAPQGAPMGAG